MNLAVIIPMYNEERNAERCVRAVCKVITDAVPDARLFVVNDGSKDRTLEILRKLAKEGIPVSIINHELNGGYGSALSSGIRHCHREGYEFGLFMDSDLTNDPGLIPAFAEKLAQGSYDVVKASRYIPNGGMKGVPAYRRGISIAGNQVASRLFGMGIRDCTNGFRAIRLSMVADLELKEKGFPMIMEELYHLKKKGARAGEIPYILTSRSAAEGASSFHYSFDTIYRYLKYAWQAAFIRRHE
jgi:dolichol-phosphate mannosyltransferase